MNVRVFPSQISGKLVIPGSKSVMQRFCALALLRDGETEIHQPSFSEDDKAALGIIQILGATVQQEEESMLVSGGMNMDFEGTLNCGESGLACRMFTPIAALGLGEVTVTGRGSLLHRPMKFFHQVLPELGVAVQSKSGLLPVTVQGPLQPKNITVDGSDGSQFITGLLFAFGSVTTQPVTIQILKAVSRPYIDLSLQCMKLFGFRGRWMDSDVILIEKREEANGKLSVSVEGDWSNAAFYCVAAALAGTIQLIGLNEQSFQGDSAILHVLKQAGVPFEQTTHQITVSRTRHIKAFTYDATHTPDLIPPLAVLAMYAEGTSSLTGMHRLIHKESNRKDALESMLMAFGIQYHIENDSLFITGGKVRGAEVDGFNDHRMVMAVAVAALRAEDPVTIEGAEAVSKSNPLFFEHLAQLGVHVESVG